MLNWACLSRKHKEDKILAKKSMILKQQKNPVRIVAEKPLKKSLKNSVSSMLYVLLIRILMIYSMSMKIERKDTRQC